MSASARLALNHNRATLIVHVVWATSGRAPLLREDRDAWFRDVLTKRARREGSLVMACGNTDDHVHALVRYPSTVAVATLMQALKGYSSYAWNLAVSMPRLTWQPGYWAESVSPDAVTPIAQYVEAQREHHRHAALLEPWALRGRGLGQ